jgi:hypothetical protein
MSTVVGVSGNVRGRASAPQLLAVCAAAGLAVGAAWHLPLAVAAVALAFLVGAAQQALP